MTLLAMSFVGAGLAALPAAIALLFGATLGTTTGAWLIPGFGLKADLAHYAMPLLALGLLGSRLLQGGLLRHTAPASPLREAHDDLRMALAEGLNRLANAPGTRDIEAPLEEVRRHWQQELAERLRQHRLDPWLASSLMNDLHQTSRLTAALTSPHDDA